MASPSAILKASLASKAMPAGVRPNPVPQVGQGPYIGRISPLVQQLSNERGYANLYGNFLPRPARTFTEGAFSPFAPIQPVPVDTPPEGFERPRPRRYQYDVGYNLPQGQPGDGYKLAPFDVLKSLSKTYSIARRCLQVRKKEVLGLPWDIQMTGHAEKAYQGDRAAQRDFGERRAKAMKFFRKPDPNFFNFTNWLSALIEQVLSIDALSLYMCPKKGTGLRRGMLGSDLDGLWLIDGATMRPLLDLDGGYPPPPAPAYQQYLYGVPRGDFTTVIAGLDLEELEGAEARNPDGSLKQYRGDQLLYLPMEPFADSPYGFGPVEQCIVPIMTGLRKQALQLEFFSEGTVPAVYISPGDTSMTPNQIRELQDALNGIAGDQAFHWKVIVLPPGSKTQPQKTMEIVDQADEWIANEVAMIFGVNPMDLGILPKVSTVASPFAAREMAQASRVQQEKTDTRPFLNFLAAIPDFILQVVCGQEDMEFVFEGQREVQDEAALTDMLVKQAQIGVRSIDEVRGKLDLPPWGLPETSGPLTFTPMGPIPMAESVALAEATARQRALPAGSGGKKPASAKPLPSGTTAGRQRARGGSALTPAHAASEGFMPERSPKRPQTVPAHPQASVKMALAELEALTRHLRKGREISTWETRNLPERALSVIAEQMARGADPEQAATLAKTIVLPPAAYQWAEKAQNPQQQAQAQQQALAQQYAAQIQAAFAAAAAAIAALIAQWAAGTLAVTAAALALLIAAEIRKALKKVLDALWADAWHHGEKEAGGTDPAGLAAFLATWGRQVAEWVEDTGIGRIVKRLHDLAGMKRKALVAEILALLDVVKRSHLIAVTEIARAWWQAVLAVWKLQGVLYKGWKTRNDARVCKRCRANQEQGFIPLGARFSSGDEHPGAHPGCRCVLIRPPKGWKPPVTVFKATGPDDMEAFQERGEPVRQRYGIDGTAGDAQDAPHPFTRDGDHAWCVACGMPRSHPAHNCECCDGAGEHATGHECYRCDAGMHPTSAEWATPFCDEVFRDPAVHARGCPHCGKHPFGASKAKRRHRGVNLDGEIVWSEGDDDEPDWVTNPAGGGGRTFYPHRADGTEVPGGVPGASAGGEPPRWDASIPERRGYINARSEDDAAWPDRGMDVPESPDEDWPDGGDGADLWPGGGHGTEQSPVTSTGTGRRGRAPNAMGKAADAAARFLDGAPKAKASAVRKLMEKNFPPGSLAWTGRARWAGPVEMPLELIDASGRKKWAASHERGHVDAIAADLKAGKKVGPAILVIREGHNRARLVDGRHRFMACEKLGWPLRAYVGFVSDGDLGAAYDTYHQQFHAGDDPQNKAVKAASGYDLSPRSGMISLDVPDGLIEPLPGGVGDHHVTVAYLGADVGDELLARVLAETRKAAAAAPGPLAGALSGVGSFPPSDGSDWKVPVFIPARVPGAEKLRKRLEHLSASEHKDWKPHVTLAYLEPGDPLPAPGHPVPVTFTHLSVHRGGEAWHFPLGG